jgi:hypothetical protein
MSNIPLEDPDSNLLVLTSFSSRFEELVVVKKSDPARYTELAYTMQLGRIFGLSQAKLELPGITSRIEQAIKAEQSLFEEHNDDGSGSEDNNDTEDGKEGKGSTGAKVISATAVVVVYHGAFRYYEKLLRTASMQVLLNDKRAKEQAEGKKARQEALTEAKEKNEEGRKAGQRHG